jgi:maleate isomerase
MRATIRPESRVGGTRVGLIIPSVNATIEPEFYRVAPRGLSFHSARVPLPETTPEALRRMNREVGAAARLLSDLEPAAVAYACTSGSFLDGPSMLERLRRTLARWLKCPVVLTSMALIQALEHLQVRRLALATPYLDAVTDAERTFLAQYGFEVVVARGLGLSGPAIREVAPEQVYRLAMDAHHRAAQALVISCTDLRAMETIEALEAELNKPVLTSNQVLLWALLRVLGRNTHAKWVGRLGAGG